jgi:hypothetical protein
VVVDPVRGSDTGGDGSPAAPLATVAAALRAARRTRPAAAGSECARTILLKAGVHYLNETMRLGEADTGLCISGAVGENATLSGGMELSLTWAKHGTAGVYVAELPAGVQSFDQLFVGSRRDLLCLMISSPLLIFVLCERI